MADYTLQTINSNECVGNSLSTINTNFDTITQLFGSLETKINLVSASDLTKIKSIQAGDNVIIQPSTELNNQNSYVISANIPLSSNAANLLSIKEVKNVPLVPPIGAVGLYKGIQIEGSKKTALFKSLIPGRNVTITSSPTSDLVVIGFDNSNSNGEINTTGSLGVGTPRPLGTGPGFYPLIGPKAGTVLLFKSLVAGPGIALSASRNSVQISNTNVYTAANTVGPGVNLLRSTTNNTFTFRKLLSGSPNVVLQETDTSITLSVQDTLSATNTAFGAGIFKEKNILTNKLVFKGLTTNAAPTAADLSPSEAVFIESANSVNLTVFDKVTAQNTPHATYIPPVRGQAGKLFKNKLANTLNFKTIIPGNNVHITNSANGNEIIISAVTEDLSGGGAVNTATNIGGGKEVFKERNGVELLFRTLSAGKGIDLFQSDETILLSAAPFPTLSNFVLLSALTGTNVGNGIGIFDAKNESNLQFKSLSSTSPLVTFQENLATKTILLSSKNIVTAAENLEVIGGVGVYSAAASVPGGTKLQFKQLAAGAGITLASVGNQITITNAYVDPSFLNQNTSGFKNRIINGNFDIWQWQQRASVLGGAVSATEVLSLTLTGNAPNFGYLADRIGFTPGNKVETIGSIIDPVATFSKVPIAFSDTNSSTGMLSSCSPFYAGRITLGVRALSAYVPTTVGQRIENVRALAGKRLTFSFWARSNNVGSNEIIVSYMQCYKSSATPLNTACYQYPSEPVETFSLTNSWERYSSTFVLPDIVEAFWEDRWPTDDSSSSANSFTQIGIEIAGNSGRYVDIVGLQLEENAQATEFEKRPIAFELDLCQRYYEIGNNFHTQFATNSANHTHTSFKVTKRIAPIMINSYGVLLKNSITNIPNVAITEHNYHSTTIDSFTTAFTGENVLGNTKPFIYNWAASAEF